MNKKILLVITTLLMISTIFTGCKPTTEPATENPIVTITMEDGGVIKAELYPDIAPETVHNFISLINEKFYDGLTFHRIIPGFMIQGGDPNGDGTGGPGYSIKGEFSSNGVENNLSHDEGILSMARSSLPNSAGSQFFIMDKANTNLDGNYAAFGKVIEGMDVVKEITTTPLTDKKDPYGDTAGEPVEPPVIKSITVDTKGVEYPEPIKIIFSTEVPPYDKELPIVTITMEDGSTIKAELYPQVAPNTVNNFISLANKGFYDGLTFHRIIPDFMIQGGCPDGTGGGGPGYAIKGEFFSNNIANTLAHTEGVLSMARSNHPDSAGSQFFIMDGVTPHLNGSYAAFGKVIAGMDALKKIVETPLTDDKDPYGNSLGKPINPPVIKSITVDTKGVSYPEPEKIE